jgi:hypothetical protein
MTQSGGMPGSHEIIQIGPSRPPSRWLRVLVVVAVLAGSAVVWLVVRGGAPDSPATRQPDRMVAYVSVGPHMLGVTADWELFARGAHELVRIEPATGRVTRTPVPRLMSTGPVSFIVGPDRAVIRPLDYVPGYQVIDGERARSLPSALRAGGLILPGPKPATVWLPNPRGSVLRLVRLTGRPTDISIRLPNDVGWLPIPDGSGYVLGGPPGVWRARPDGVTQISRGALLATGPTGWLVRECSQGTCKSVVIDRRTGDRRTLPGPALRLGYYGAIAPDGSTAAVFDQEPYRRGITVSLLDLHTGERRAVPVWVSMAPGEGTVVWSPDSRWLFAPRTSGGLAIVDASTGEVRDLEVPLPQIEQLAVRTP